MWFRKGFDPGTIVTLDKPAPSQWQIIEKLNEHNYQLDEHDDHTKRRFMRIYLQVPFHGTEMDDADTRASQAMTIMPPELTAYQYLTEKQSSNTPKLLGYKISTQDKSGPVPGGFVVRLVWEMVPGLRLGSKTGPDVFWDLDASERQEIREAFMEGFRKMEYLGYRNDGAGLSSLVWNQQSKTLYFIGFNLCNAGKIPRSDVPTDFDITWVARYGLAIPNSKAWRKEGWNGDTSGWKW
ncbi:hypothetical protein CDV55_106549 [Aspergillus turcosus]|uniref:Uncharacterized protein n=1 Tax=Aspergillus turcosus TaxID=1245748 RepID=A0A229X144_9EURO|nr:hypothetical protein CDV55_106549 [Aspergillus turcosus]RLM00225.1 hypothetical protein CFD26_106696 [Aspergillus turcosus]